MDRIQVIRGNAALIKGPGLRWSWGFVGSWINWRQFELGFEGFGTDGGAGLGVYIGPVMVVFGWFSDEREG